MKSNLFAPLALAAALALTTVAVGAQTQPPPPHADATGHEHHMPDADHQLKHMTKRLNLTDTQQQQIRPILADRDKQVLAIRNDAALTPEQQHQNTGKVMRDSMSQIRNVLTDSQRQQWDQAREQMREHRHGQPTAPTAPATPPPPSM